MTRQIQWAALTIVAVAVLPFAVLGIGLTLTSATDVLIFALAGMALNLLVGYTGLTSFGHSAWLGVSAYAAALFQLWLLPEHFLLPLIGAVVLTTVLGTVAGFLALRRTGVYFSLLTLAIAAMAHALAFRWNEVTGGENGLGGIQRNTVLGLELDRPWVFYTVAAVIILACVFLLSRIVNSPVGSVLRAIRDNEVRARFLGYTTRRYKLAAFVVSVVITAVCGALLTFNHRFASPDAMALTMSGELLAMVVIGGMHSFFGPAIGALFFILFREYLSIWTDSWLLWFGLTFMAFLLFSPNGIAGIVARISSLRKKADTEEAAMANRRVSDGTPLPPDWTRDIAEDSISLDVGGLSKRFGNLQAVRDVGLELGPQGVVALIGPNGAGKTTAFNLISGMFEPDSGSVKLHGKEIARLPAEEVCRAGLARSFQITSLFKELTVEENIRLAVQGWHPSRFQFFSDARSVQEVIKNTAAIIRYLGLEGLEHVKADSLSYGGQRVVDLGLALATRPKVLLLDEPLAGLSAKERDRITNLIKRTAEHLPILLIEHDIDRAFGLARTVTVMNEGQVLVHGDPEEVRRDTRVREVYTGSGNVVAARRAPTRPGPSAKPVLALNDVHTFYGKSHILNGVSLDVRPGEIVALLGRNGAGKSTLLKSIIGIAPVSRGQISLNGTPMQAAPTHEIARAGIGYVPQGRGLFAGMSLDANLQLGRLGRRSVGTPVWPEDTAFAQFPRLKERLSSEADRLSGGEQQMAAVARALAGPVKVLLLDEPFEGLAPAVVEELFNVFDAMRGRLAIVIVEHNLDLVLSLADRAYVLDRGAVSYSGPACELERDLELRHRVLWV